MNLEELYNYTKSQYPTIIVDFNARIGKADRNFTYHQETNKNVLLLIYIINEKQLVITNTYFQKKLDIYGCVLQEISA